MSDANTSREAYGFFCEIQSRWMDNDIYGHVNNVTYYSYFDTVANNYLIEHGGLDIQNAEVVGFVVSSRCEYLAPIAHPCTINAGFRVNKLGTKSVEYGIAIFDGDAQQAAAWGTFTHVFVERASGKSTAIPEPIRTALQNALFEQA
ncbi:MAG: acyl-CoA thioesterase [Gammaproteobacteria bacterium]|nr:acyl-CoA thioesterase [Gammaproteobacteria bacterium]